MIDAQIYYGDCINSILIKLGMASKQKGAYQWDFSQQPIAVIDVFFFETCLHAENISSSHGSRLFGGHAIPMIYLDDFLYKCRLDHI